MITSLTRVKARLGLVDASQDTRLTDYIGVVAARIELELDRRLERAVGHVQEFDACRREIVADRYPIEQVTTIDKLVDGAWVQQADASTVLLQRGAVIQFVNLNAFRGERARVTYTGGYVFPDPPGGQGAYPLPTIIEACAVEQICFMYQRKDVIGIYRAQDAGGVYLEVANTFWVPWVRTMLTKYKAINI